MKVYRSQTAEILYIFWEKHIKTFQLRRLFILCLLLFLTFYGAFLYFENSENKWNNHPFPGKNPTVIIYIPTDTIFTWDSTNEYIDWEKGIQVRIKEDELSTKKYINDMDNDRNKVKDDLKGTSLRLGTLGWNDVNGWYYILVKDPNSDKSVAIGSKNKDISIKMAKNVIFI
jgi:hypothetical protein